MGGISQYLAQEALDHIVGGAVYTAPGTLYLALFNVGHGTTPLTEADLTGNEVTVAGYSRQTITFATATLLEPEGAISRSDSAPTFTADPALSESTDAWGLFDASSGGNLLFWGEIGQVNAIVDDTGFTIPSGDLGCRISGTVSNYAAAAFMDLVLTGTAFASPSTFVALSDVAAFTLLESDAVANELSSPGYARVSVSFAAAVTDGVGARSDQNADADFPIAEDLWPSANAFLVFDAVSSGNLLWFGRMSPTSPLAGQQLRLPSGYLRLKLGA